jgi:tyrosine-protein phosphatase SIW14
MQTLRAILFGSFIALFMLLSPIVYKRWHDAQYRNFRVVEEGVLYRSGQLPLHRLKQLVGELGIRTVISLRDGDHAIDQDEEAWVKSNGLHFARIPHRPWLLDASGQIPAEIGLREFRSIMDDPKKHPVLVHCYAGIHRTGTTCAIYRIDYQNWTSAEAMAEMRVMGYTILDDHVDVRDYFTKYRRHSPVRTVPIVPVSRTACQIEGGPVTP